MRKMIIIVLCLGLGACAHAPQSVYLSPKQRQQALSRVITWRAQGSVSITTQGKRNMLSFNWNQMVNDLFVIRFSAFTYSVVLRNDHGRLTLSQPMQDIYPGLWQSLIATQFWLRGLAAPSYMGQGRVMRRYDQYGRIATLVQNGWLIQYQHYQNYSGYDLPIRLVISRQNIQCRLAINHWFFISNMPKKAVASRDVLLLRSV